MPLKSLVLAGLLLALTSPAGAAPAPPPQLMDVFSDLIEIEEQIEEQEWAEARDHFAVIETALDAMAEELAAAVPASQLAELGSHRKVFGQTLADRDAGAAYSSFLRLHQDFLEIMGNFEYKLPPLLYLVQNDLREAEEAIEEGDFSEAASESGELEIFYQQSIPLLVEKGISQKIIDSFRTRVTELKAAIEAEDRSRAETVIADLRQMFDLQHSLFASR